MYTFPRKREYVYAGIALALAFLWANNMSFADALDQDGAEKEARVYRQIKFTEHQRDKANAERYAKALAACLNGGGFETEATRVSCRARPIHTQQASR